MGIPREVKVHEYRVSMMPAGVRELVAAGHEVLVESHAGEGVGVSDVQYMEAGARICTNANEVFGGAELIVKVKEPEIRECQQLRKGQVLFTYLHLAANSDKAGELLKSGCSAIAYETVTSASGSLPLLTPMSEVAGRLSVQVAASCLQKANGGSGVLLGGVPGVLPARVVILGGGVAGIQAAQMAMGLGAEVTVVESSAQRLRELSSTFGSRLKTVYSTTEAIEQLVIAADVVIGAVLIPGASTPRLVTTSMVERMVSGTVLVDIAIDQGGCFETSRPTTHANPTYVISGVVHYCVTNMPSAVPRTSTLALTNATLPYIRALADQGMDVALSRDRHLAAGLNVHQGVICHAAVARDLQLEYRPPSHIVGRSPVLSL